MKRSYKNSSLTRLRRRRHCGAVTVEVCIFLPLLIMITFAIIQFGYIFFKEIELTDLSRDAMRYLAVQGVGANGPNAKLYADASEPTSVRAYVQNEATSNGNSFASGDLKVNIYDYQTGSPVEIAANQTTNLPAAGDRVAVTLQYNMTTSNTILLSPLVPFASNFLGEQKRTTQMIMEYPIQ